MVVPSYFKDILQTLDDSTVLNLPTFKEKILKLQYYENSDIEDAVYSQELTLPFSDSKVYEADISDWKRLSADFPICNPIYEITLSLQNSDVHFKPGDTIGIIPTNHKEEVDEAIRHLDIENIVDSPYTLMLDCDRKGAKIPPHVPIKSTLRHTLTHCIDLRGVLKKVFLVVLSKYTTDKSEKKVLEYLSSKEGFLAYTSNILNKSICILDIFQMFKSCKPPVEVILEHLPRLLPRPYSICSSYLKDPNKIKICFSVKDIGNDRKGLMTSWLEELIIKSDDVEKKLEGLSLSEKTKIPIYFRKNINEFRMPENLELPVILIGPGTGVAPFMGFLEERDILLNKHNVTKEGSSCNALAPNLVRSTTVPTDVPCIWLFNGCRYENYDFIYKTEISNFITKGVLTKMFTAFSRDENSENKYVQDCISKHGKEVSKLIEDGAHIFVCGDVNKIAKDVKETIVKCVEQHTSRTYEEAVKFVLELEKQRRYLVDVWN